MQPAVSSIATKVSFKLFIITSALDRRTADLINAAHLDLPNGVDTNGGSVGGVKLAVLVGFLKLGDNFIETIINKSEALKKTKKELAEQDEEVSKEKKAQLSKEEKEEKSKRKQIQEKLIKFATRIPVFMYLTDFREMSLRDVITKIDSELFMKVTGLTVQDFELLVSIGLFNENLMNTAVFMFRRYEDDSLSYTGINKHEGGKIGGYSTVLSRQEVFENID